MRAVVLLPLILFSIALSGAESAAPPAAVAKIAAQAVQARDSNRPEEALRLYTRALQIAPKWDEGWWQAGTIQYGLDRYADCGNSFRKFVALKPAISAGFAFLGLCEFQTRDFGLSLTHLERAVTLGLPNGEQLSDVALYHLALLHTRAGDFERALQFCTMLARKTEVDPKVVAVAGTAALRRPVFPHELPEDDRELAARLGRALLTAGAGSPEETNRNFEDIIRDYPHVPSVHYTYATVLLANSPGKGEEQLKKELEIDPNHLPALVSLAMLFLNRNEPAAARPYAEKAAGIAPRSFAARACFGRVLLASGGADLPAAIRELEAAVKLAPDSPQAHFSLGAAYAQADRKADAARERAEFRRLQNEASKSSAAVP